VRWETLGTYGFLATDDPAHLRDAFALAREVLADVDRTCSRFRDDSDLVRANARPGRWVAVDPLLVAAVEVGVAAARTTDGLVDPCLGRPLVQLGYDADLAVVRRRATGPTTLPTAPTAHAWREIRTDPEGALRVPAGCAIDLGATAKAWASDLVAATVVDRLGCHLVVSLGGDLRVAGPDGVPHPGWPVSVTERPDGPDVEQVWLSAGGLATSSTTARRWAHGTGEVHHVVDPRTGRPTDEHWRTATATGPTCAAANVASTAALVLGTDAPAWLAAHGVTARLIDRDGAHTRVGDWPAPETHAPTPTAVRTMKGED
ncbi:MAG: FAD:protein FMN transferase, partial [Nocardioidaceae bacterium]|nr:FAD:protein FMN transferase [Nocardioidaceae bacterium]